MKMNKKSVLAVALSLSFAMAPVTALANSVLTVTPTTGDKPVATNVKTEDTNDKKEDNNVTDKKEDTKVDDKVKDDKKDDVKKEEGKTDKTKVEYKTVDEYLKANGIKYLKSPTDVAITYVDKTNPHGNLLTELVGGEKQNTTHNKIVFTYEGTNKDPIPASGMYVLSVYKYNDTSQIVDRGNFYNSPTYCIHSMDGVWREGKWDGSNPPSLNHNSVTKGFKGVTQTYDEEGFSELLMPIFVKNNVTRGQIVFNIFDKAVDIDTLRKIEPNDTKWSNAIIYDFDLNEGRITKLSKNGVTDTAYAPAINPSNNNDTVTDGDDGGSDEIISGDTTPIIQNNADAYSGDRATVSETANNGSATNNGNNQNAKADENPVKTGDDTNLAMLGLALVMAQLGVVAVIRNKKLSAKGDRLS